MSTRTQDILRFGSFHRRRLISEAVPKEPAILRQQEALGSRDRALIRNFDVKTAYLQYLNYESQDYSEVRAHILAILQVWDAVIDEKQYHDAGGRPRRTTDFMQAFLTCMDVIPGRMDVGSLGLGSKIAARTLSTVAEAGEKPREKHD